MPMTSLPELGLARKTLRDWCTRHHIGPQQLADSLHCEYKYAWAVLRGNYRLSLPLLGRLLIVFGPNGPAPAMAAAFKAELDRRRKAEMEAGQS